MIHLAAAIVATAADLLNGTRLQSAPRDGVMIIQLQANLNNATNGWAVTLEDPDGNTPVTAQAVSGNNPSLDGVMDTRTLDRYEFNLVQGGHMTITLTESGTAILYYKITFVF